MTEKVKLLLEQLKNKEYKKQRRNIPRPEYGNFGDVKEFVNNFRMFIESQKPLIFEGDNFGFNLSTNTKLEFIHGNLTPDYQRALNLGFDSIRNTITEAVLKTDDVEKIEFGFAMRDCIDILYGICDKYKACAKKQGNEKLYAALSKIPHGKAESFYEACAFVKICIFFLRSAFVNHLGLGRFDRYMYPFYLADKEKGISDEEILETIEEFFISINRDTDLYACEQQGDNGQSMVLGGFDTDGQGVYNSLSKLCIEASLELCLIDPKINLRVGKNTPNEVYEYATRLTKKGLGFPQYSNDDVVVPGLVKLGYKPEDAVEYSVAACWEFVVPGKGMDMLNVGVLDFPNVVNSAIVENLEKCSSFEELMRYVDKYIQIACDAVVDRLLNREWWKAPGLSVLCGDCIETLKDLSFGGAEYFNFGCHGAGIANAADALAAVKENVFDKKTLSAKTLVNMLKSNFDRYEKERELLLKSPKMGNNEEYVDEIACRIMDMFSKGLNGRSNGHGGVWRAGTGSAMEYVKKGSLCPATADGRMAGEPYSSSFSPSWGVKTAGLLSVIQSFTKYDLTKTINGGPLTVEIHDSALRNEDGIKKLAMLVKNFILMGGHQLQINSVNRDVLIDAQKNPDKYPNLIVRVWGWSGYFNELDEVYQNHIIGRCEYNG